MPPTGADGSASVSALGYGPYVLSATASGYGSAAQQVMVSSGPITTVEIRLESVAGNAEGRVTDGVSEEALGGATVSLAQWTAVTDAAGRYRIEEVPPGSYTLQVSLQGYATHQTPATIEPRGSLSLDVVLSPLPGLLKVRVVDAATGLPIEGATVSYESTAASVQGDEACADYALLVPLKRSRQYRIVRSRVSDPRPSDAWQEYGLHFFVFTLGGDAGEAPSSGDPPVAVFVMRPGVAEPLSAVVVRPRSDGEEAETTPIGEGETA